MTKNVGPPAQETGVVANTSKLLKESHKLRRIIAGWMDDLVCSVAKQEYQYQFIWEHTNHATENKPH